ncbi:MAG: sigma factor [Methanogenium sp.]
MSHVIRIRKKGGGSEKVSVAKILKDNENFIRNIANKWKNSFSFDQSLDTNDLYQELLMKLYFSLDRYDYEQSTIKTYISKICRNYLISKRKSLLKNNGKTFKIAKIVYLSEKVQTEDCEITLEEMLEGNIQDPEHFLWLKRLLDNVKEQLDLINYCPIGYTNKLRTFSRRLFDTLYDSRKQFTNYLMFEHNCSKRYHKHNGGKIPKKVVPSAKMVAKWLGVDIRAINLGMRIIRKVIKKCSSF